MNITSRVQLLEARAFVLVVRDYRRRLAMMFAVRPISLVTRVVPALFDMKHDIASQRADEMQSGITKDALLQILGTCLSWPSSQRVSALPSEARSKPSVVVDNPAHSRPKPPITFFARAKHVGCAAVCVCVSARAAGSASSPHHFAFPQSATPFPVTSHVDRIFCSAVRERPLPALSSRGASVAVGGKKLLVRETGKT